MADEHPQKTPLERSRDIISVLKEMHHYSKSNIEKLSAVWMELDDELKQKEIAEQINNLLPHQNAFYEALEQVIEEFETVCNKQEQGA